MCDRSTTGAKSLRLRLGRAVKKIIELRCLSHEDAAKDIGIDVHKLKDLIREDHPHLSQETHSKVKWWLARTTKAGKEMIMSSDAQSAKQRKIYF